MKYKISDGSPLAGFRSSAKRWAVGSGIGTAFLAMCGGAYWVSARDAYMRALSSSTLSSSSYSSSSYASTHAYDEFYDTQAVADVLIALAAIAAFACAVAIIATVAANLAVAYKTTEAEREE